MDITFPRKFENNKRIHLYGLPFWGAEVQIKKHINGILSTRTESDFKREWSKLGYDILEVRHILKKIYTCLWNAKSKLDNYYFFPNDSAKVLFLAWTGNQCAIRAVLRNKLFVRREIDEEPIFYDLLDTSNVKSIVDLIISEKLNRDLYEYEKKHDTFSNQDLYDE